MKFVLKKFILIGVMIILVVGLASTGARAANHALLIGIGEYKTRTLQGPPHDEVD